MTPKIWYSYNKIWHRVYLKNKKPI